jgi:hypothetical protein
VKRGKFILLSFIILLSGCNKSSGTIPAASAIKEMKGETVYYENGKEASFNGNVFLYNSVLQYLMIPVNLGTVENGKLTMTLFDIDLIEGIPSNMFEKIQNNLDDLDLHIKVIPEDAKWFSFKYPLNPSFPNQTARIVLFSDDKVDFPIGKQLCSIILICVICSLLIVISKTTLIGVLETSYLP